MVNLIVFLGNPGIEYRQSRHNVGWMCIPYLSFHTKLQWQRKFKGEIAIFSISGNNRYFLKPLTSMNRSGESVSGAAAFYRVPPENCMVVHDEIELDFGVSRIRQDGGLAGHKGLRSVAGLLGGNAFQRLRIGIGRPLHGSVSSHVLGRFTQQERASLDDVLHRAASLIEGVLDD